MVVDKKRPDRHSAFVPRHSGSLDSNQRAVVQQLRVHGPQSRAQLTSTTGLSRGTVVQALAALNHIGLVEEDERDPARRTARVGRPPAVVRLSRRAGVAVGIDLGKRHLRVAVSDLAHVVLAETEVPVNEDLSAADAAALTDELLAHVLNEADAARTSILGAGVAVPGPLHQDTGRLGSSTILPGWAGIEVVPVFQERLGVPIRVDNDANLGALAEKIWGAGQHHRDFAYIRLATGIGCGLVLNGEIYRGAGGTAGEIGHIVMDANGAICRCGNRGCLETIAGTSAIISLLEPTLGAISLADVVQGCLDGEPTCHRVVSDTGAAIGTALAGLVNLFNPGLILLGGMLAACHDALFEPLRMSLSRSSVPSAVADVTIAPATLPRPELYGALAVVLQDPTLALQLSGASVA